MFTVRDNRGNKSETITARMGESMGVTTLTLTVCEGGLVCVITETIYIFIFLFFCVYVWPKLPITYYRYVCERTGNCWSMHGK